MNAATVVPILRNWCCQQRKRLIARCVKAGRYLKESPLSLPAAEDSTPVRDHHAVPVPFPEDRGTRQLETVIYIKPSFDGFFYLINCVRSAIKINCLCELPFN